MSQRFEFQFAASDSLPRRARVGVVASGDAEVLLTPTAGNFSSVTVCSRIQGFELTWHALLQRFFERHPLQMQVQVNDAGATPGVVWLRLEQALEQARSEEAR